MEHPESIGNLLAYGILWAFIALCVFLVVRWTLLFVSIVAIGLAEKYESLPGPIRRWLLGRAARLEPSRPSDDAR